MEVFDQVSAKLNRLLCFATFVGRWKDITPKDAMTLKRDIDEVMYANRLLFSDELFAAYRSFILCLFAVYATVDRDALIRCGISSRWGDRRNQAWWEPGMTNAFCTDRETTPQEAQEAYARLAAAFRADLYVDALEPGSATSVVNASSSHSRPAAPTAAAAPT